MTPDRPARIPRRAASDPAEGPTRRHRRRVCRGCPDTPPGSDIIGAPRDPIPSRSLPARASRRFLPLLAALLAFGCHSIRRPDFPVGLYAVRRPEDFQEVAAAGFDTIVAPASSAVLDAARREGLHVLAQPGTQAGRHQFDPGKAAHAVRRFDRHPALLAWYLSDEPDLHRVPPADLDMAHRWIRDSGGAKPTALALFDGRRAVEYAGRTDWLLIDRYPVPWMPLADFGKHVRLARFAAGPNRPLLAVLQAFDWSYYPDLLPGRTGLRAPVHAEMRAMAYLALAHGANGLLFYCFDDGKWDLRRHPETWQALKRLVQEIRFFEPLFAGRPVWWDVVSSYPRREQTFNEALDPAIETVVLRVEPGDEIVEAGHYLVAVNTTASAIDWRFHPTSVPLSELPVLNEGRWVGSESGWFTDAFAPYAVHVYGPWVAPRPAPDNTAR